MRTLLYILEDTLSDLKRNVYLIVVAIFSIALTFFVLEIFLLIVFNALHLLFGMQDELKVHVYLRDTVHTSQVRAVGERIVAIEGVEGAVYTSKEEALQEFQKIMGADEKILQGLGENPLPSSFTVTLKEEGLSERDLSRTVEKIKGFPEVDDVIYGKEWLGSLTTFLRFLKTVGLITGAAFSLAVVVITSVTLRLMIYSRQEEIKILHWSGATRWYIRAPFLFEGALIGFLAGSFSLLFLAGFFSFLQDRMATLGGPFRRGFSFSFLPVGALLAFVMGGGVLGLVGSFFPMRRVLRI